MKRIVELEHQITGVRIAFCYGAKTYHNYIRKQFNTLEYIDDGGVCTSFKKGNDFRIIIGLRKSENVYALKGLFVHELSHLVTQLFNEYGFNCDELRSYTLQWIYQEIMPTLDKWIQEDYNKKERKNGK